MTKYVFEGQQVDVKTYNLHESARIAAAVSAGDVVAFDATDTSLIRPCTTLAPANAVGVVLESRDSTTDPRPVSYTILGVVRVVADGAISVGAAITPSVTTAGQVKAAAGTDRVIGRAKTASTGAGQTIIALVNLAQ